MKKTNSETITVKRSVPTAVEPSPRVMQIASMFGLGIDETRHMTIIPETTLTLTPGKVIFINGPSGSGKSTLLNLIEKAVKHKLRFDGGKNFTDAPLVDQIGETLEQATQTFALAGLADAFVMLRKPHELSDGQRYRASLASLIDQTQKTTNSTEAISPIVVLADEFGATLDRLTASLVARNIRRWIQQSGTVCFICATTHDDLLESLNPDTLIYLSLDGGIEIHQRTSTVTEPDKQAG